MMSYHLVLACSGLLGSKVLKYFYKRKNIVAVLTDKKSIEIINFCNKYKIIFFVGNARSDDCFEFIQRYKNDILFSVNYLYLFNDKILNIFNSKINIHGSLLPKYRGRTPHVWAIINNEKETGITIHNMTLECDAGDILLQKRIPIKYSDTGGSILEKYIYHYPKMMEQFLCLLENGKIVPQQQDKELASYFEKRSPEDGKIVWDWQRERLYNWVRALAPPYPGAFCYVNNIKMVIKKIVFSEFGFSCAMKNGTVVDIKQNTIIVKTPNGCIAIMDYIMDDAIYSLKKGDILL